MAKKKFIVGQLVSVSPPDHPPFTARYVSERNDPGGERVIFVQWDARSGKTQGFLVRYCDPVTPAKVG